MKVETAIAATAAGPGTSDNPGTKTVSEALAKEPNAVCRIMEDAIRASLAGPKPGQEAAPADVPAEVTPPPETPEPPSTDAEPASEPEAQPAEESGEPPASGDESEPVQEDKRKEQWPESARKRVDKLTAKRRELEEALNEKEAKIAELEKAQQTAPEPSASPPQQPAGLDEIQTVEALNRYEETAENVMSGIEDYQGNRMSEEEKAGFEKYLSGLGLFNPETGEVNVGGVSRLYRDLRQTVKAIPRRRHAIEEEARIEPQIHKLYPYWADRTSQEYTEAQKVIQAFPELRKHPNWKHLVSLFLRGVKDEARSLQEGKAKPPVNGSAAKPPPKVPGTPAAAVAPASKVTMSKEDRDRAISGSKEDRENWVRRLLPKLSSTG
jgi:hypothetical protein